MRIWIDADAAPGPVREIIFKASARLLLPVTLVANSWQRIPRTPLLRQALVGSGADVADDHIVEHCLAGDLVITSDIPLAARIVEKGALAITFRGELLDEENVRERLSVRDMLEEVRNMGVMTGGPPPFGPGDRQRFANALDRVLAKRVKAGG